MTALRERPTAFAAAVVRQAELVDQPLQALRFLERIEVLALDVLDQRQRRARPGPGTSRTSAGTSRRPACCAARQRRSPAMIS